MQSSIIPSHLCSVSAALVKVKHGSSCSERFLQMLRAASFQGRRADSASENEAAKHSSNSCCGFFIASDCFCLCVRIAHRRKEACGRVAYMCSVRTSQLPVSRPCIAQEQQATRQHATIAIQGGPK